MANAAAKTPVRVQNIQVRLAEHARNHWEVTVPVDHSEHDCIAPAYLWLRHDLIKVGDKVTMIREDFAFEIDVRVIKIDRETQSIHTRIIAAVDWKSEDMPAADLSAAVIEQAGADKWRVTLDKEVLSRGHATRQEAERWLSKRRGEREAA